MGKINDPDWSIIYELTGSITDVIQKRSHKNATKELIEDIKKAKLYRAKTIDELAGKLKDLLNHA
jgi:hypothetical protein